MHEDCWEQPPGHPLSQHSPWSGSDLDGIESWDDFVARLARHGLVLASQPVPETLDVDRLAVAMRPYFSRDCLPDSAALFQAENIAREYAALAPLREATDD
jgi:hypothetical protein